MNDKRTLGPAVVVMAATAAALLMGLSGCALPTRASAAGPTGEAVRGWLNWRGPQQNGTSLETHLASKWQLGGANDLWSIPLRGRGTPLVVSTPRGDRAYVWGYHGTGPNERQVLACLDAATGKTIWSHEFNDFISDTIYDRYAIGAPVIDPATGDVYLVDTAGDFHCYTPDGKPVWMVPMMEAMGKMTFPNGRIGAPVIDGDRVIVHCVTSNWGSEGAPRDRFYAFQKSTGLLVWSSDPGVGPPYLKDNSFATPVLGTDAENRRVFYCVTGDGNFVCVNALTGEPIWRHQVCMGGMNSSPVLLGNLMIGVHSLENIDSSNSGRMLAVRVDAAEKPAGKGTPTLAKGCEAWHNDGVRMFSSSPVLAEGLVYQVDQNGLLWCVDGETGKTVWTKKLGTTQVHGSPTWADGKLYVPMNDGNFYILSVSRRGCDVLSKTKLAGACLGAPAVWDGKILVFTTERLYCFGEATNPGHLPRVTAIPAYSPPARFANIALGLQIVPAEVLLRPGEKQSFTVHKIFSTGIGSAVKPDEVKWEHYIPPTAKVKATMDAEFVRYPGLSTPSKMQAPASAKISAGAWKATAGGLTGVIRGRVLPGVPYHENFEGFKLAVDQPLEHVKFAYPPLPWIGARFKWDIREVDGSKVLAKTVDNVMLIRAMSFIGDPMEHGYTMQADVRTDGNRHMKGEVGIIDQRYMFTIDGNADVFRMCSTLERINVEKPLKVKAHQWYTIKARVDLNEDGSGIVRGKVWPRGTPEPAGWTIEFKHEHANTHGSPGIFGFSPQPVTRVYIDNIAITPDK